MGLQSFLLDMIDITKIQVDYFLNSGPPDDGKHIGGPGVLACHALERGVKLVD